MKLSRLFLLTTSLTTIVCSISASDVVLTAKAEGYTAFHDAVVQAGLYEHAKKNVGEKNSMAPFTVFVPTNEAFAALKNVSADEQKKLITFHVVPGKKIEKPAEEMKSGVPTVGEQLLFMADEKIFLEDSEHKAAIIKGPITAQNGTLYIIDHVIAPAGTALPSATQPTTQAVAAPTPQSGETKASDDEEQGEAHAAAQPANAEPLAQAAQPAQLPQQPIAPIQFIPVPVPSAPQANMLTEQTGQILASNVTQLTQSIQLLIHVIQQAQQQVGTPSQAEAVPLTVIP
jgi:uncharacterized surface protein with fasciclin (FAS1) repeats